MARGGEYVSFIPNRLLKTIIKCCRTTRDLLEQLHELVKSRQWYCKVFILVGKSIVHFWKYQTLFSFAPFSTSVNGKLQILNWFARWEIIYFLRDDGSCIRHDCQITEKYKYLCLSVTLKPYNCFNHVAAWLFVWRLFQVHWNITSFGRTDIIAIIQSVSLTRHMSFIDIASSIHWIRIMCIGANISWGLSVRLRGSQDKKKYCTKKSTVI